MFKLEAEECILNVICAEGFDVLFTFSVFSDQVFNVNVAENIMVNSFIMMLHQTLLKYYQMMMMYNGITYRRKIRKASNDIFCIQLVL